MKKTLLFLSLVLGLSARAQNVGIGTTAPTDQLHTTGTVRFQNYSGVGTRLLYLDSSGHIAAPPTGTLFTNASPMSILDNGCASNSGASSPIVVSGLPTSVPSAKIAVRFNITHTFDADLNVFLFSPTGKVLRLVAEQGGNGDNYTGTIFTDEAGDLLSAGTAPFAGRYKPIGSPLSGCAITSNATNFSAMGTGGNLNPNGTWTLKVFDDAGGDTGSLQNWQITFEGQNGFGTTGANGPVPYFNNGALALSNITNSAAGNVGIGNPAPTAKLDVAGSIRIADGTQGVGKVLISDATGTGSWQSAPSTNSSFLAGISSSVTLISGGFTPVTIPYTITAGGLPVYDDVGTFGTPTAGVFTAPSTGVYHFDVGVNLSTSFSPAPTGGNFTAVAILNTSTQIQQCQRPFATGDPLPKNIQYSFTCKMVAGNTLRIGLVIFGYANVQVGSSNDSYFSGYRIY